MKVRSIDTRFWRDSYIASLSSLEKLVYLYLFTNEQVNLCGIYELLDKYICLDLSLKPAEFKKIKTKLEKDKKVFFLKGWIYLPNFWKYNKFNSLPNILYSFRDDFNRIPYEVKKELFSKHPYHIPFKNKDNIKLIVTAIAIVIDIVIVSRLGGKLGGRLGGRLEKVDPDRVIKEMEENDKKI